MLLSFDNILSADSWVIMVIDHGKSMITITNIERYKNHASNLSTGYRVNTDIKAILNTFYLNINDSLITKSVTIYSSPGDSAYTIS